MKIVVAGSSGLLGSALVPVLEADGHEVVRLVRRAAASANDLCWDPKTANLDLEAIRGTDAAINLAGAGVGDKRWTDAYKREIRNSRVGTTRFLSTMLAKLDPLPSVLLNGSAVGIYGNRGDEPLDESSATGEGFLADVCRAWEDATRPASDQGIRVVNLRTGYVIGKDSDFLRKQLLPAKLGLGGPIGGGRQFQSWIHLEDWLLAVQHLIASDVSGPANLTAPNPVRQKEFASELGKALNRPAFLPVPSFALKIVLGEFATEVVDGARVLPKVLTDAGFGFAYPTIGQALTAALKD